MLNQYGFEGPQWELAKRRNSGSGLAFCHSVTRPHPFNFENAAAIAPPVGAEAGAPAKGVSFGITFDVIDCCKNFQESHQERRG